MSTESRYFWARAAGIASVAALALVPLVSGCPGELENIEDFEEAATSGPGPLVDPCNGLITKKCALANCHDAESSSVDLTLEGREERTVNQPGVVCPGNYIDTAAPEASLMYTKCLEPTCGSRMPLAAAPLDDEELSCLLGYLQSLGAGGTGSGTSSGASSSSASSSASTSGAGSSSSGGAD